MEQPQEKGPWWAQTHEPGGQQAPADVQYQREALVSAASQMLYSDKGMEATLKSMSSGKDPLDAAAQMTATIMSASVDKMRNGGVEVNQDALFSAGREVLERIVALGKANKVLSMGESELETQQGMDATAEKALGYFQQMQQQEGQAPGGQQAPAGPQQAPPGAQPAPGGAQQAPGGQPAPPLIGA